MSLKTSSWWWGILLLSKLVNAPAKSKQMKERGNIYEPTVCKVRSDIFQISVSHIINCEDEKVIIFLDAFLDIVVEPTSLFLVRLLDRLTLVDELRALGDGHFLCLTLCLFYIASRGEGGDMTAVRRRG